MLCQVVKSNLHLSCESMTSTLLCLVSRQRDSQRRKWLLPWHPGPAFSSQGSPGFHWWTPLHQHHPQQGHCVHKNPKTSANMSSFRQKHQHYLKPKENQISILCPKWNNQKIKHCFSEVLGLYQSSHCETVAHLLMVYIHFILCIESWRKP